MPFPASDRLGKLPPYLFAAIDVKKKAAIEKGADIISLGVGDPDRAHAQAHHRGGQEGFGEGGQPPVPLRCGTHVLP